MRRILSPWSIRPAKGILNARMEDVAQELGVQRRSLYHHVSGKPELIQLVSRRMWLQAAKDEAAASESSARDRLRAFMQRYVVALTLEQPYWSEFRDQEPAEKAFDPDELEEFRGYVGRLMVDQLMAIISDGIRAGDFRDDIQPRIVAHSIVGIVAEVRRWFRPEGPLTIEEVCEMNYGILARGLSP